MHQTLLERQLAPQSLLRLQTGGLCQAHGRLLARLAGLHPALPLCTRKRGSVT